MDFSTIGRHLVVEYRGCGERVLNDLTRIQSTMENAATACGATIVDSVWHRFTPTGVSGIILVQESHLSIHTWPERQYAAVDLYTCGDLDPLKAHRVLTEGLGSTHQEVVVMLRGLTTSISNETGIEQFCHEHNSTTFGV